MIGVIARKMVGDRHRLQHPGITNQFGKFLALIRPVKTSRHQNRDAGSREARFEQGLDHRAEKHMIGNRPRNVANEDASRLLAFCKFDQRRRANRLSESRPNRSVRRRQHRHRRFADHADIEIIRKVERQPLLAVIQIDPHKHPPRMHPGRDKHGTPRALQPVA